MLVAMLTVGFSHLLMYKSPLAVSEIIIIIENNVGNFEKEQTKLLN